MRTEGAIRIAYRELPPGLHGEVGHDGRGVVVYFVPGLTSAQRRAVLRRLRQEARMGIGRPLPAWRLGLALAADRVRAGLRNIGAIFRRQAW